MTTIRIIVVFIIGILLIIFALNNSTQIVQVDVFGKSYEKPLSLIMLYAYVFGIVTIGFFWLINEIKLRTELRRQRKENEALLAELTALRNLPLDITQPNESLKIESKKEQ
ncbi:MAG: LapA family protein [candidate division WOR-3 bacterium]|nr:LapA family protein [candidate division WOR-3 bacterium]